MLDLVVQCGAAQSQGVGQCVYREVDIGKVLPDDFAHLGQELQVKGRSRVGEGLHLGV